MIIGLAGLYATVGCHPCSAKQFDEYPGGPEAYLDALEEVIEKNLGGMKGKGKVVAVGETGLGTPSSLRHFTITDEPGGRLRPINAVRQGNSTQVRFHSSFARLR